MSDPAVEAFLRDPNHLVCDDGLELGDLTDKPHLYRLPSLRRRLLPVLTLLPSAVFKQLAQDRNLLFVAAPSPSGPWPGPPDATDPAAHGAYAARGRNLNDPVMFKVDLPFGSWVIKLGRIEVELATPEVFAGVVIHECLHVYLDHNFGLRTIDRAAVQQAEDEAVERACQIGFRRQTTAFLTFYATRFPNADVIMGRLPPP
jgi:hypothetical protein